MDNTTTTGTAKATWADLMVEAITKPGRLEASFRAFYGYSLGNRLYAMGQCIERGITPGPLATFRKWSDLGRWVRKGERALRLLMPIEVGKSCGCAKCSPEAPSADKCRRGVIFVEKSRWFVLAQTDGAPITQDAPPASWSKERALAALNITEAPFDHMNGNVQGYAKGRTVRVSPIAQNPTATLFHELAHIVLGHTDPHTQQLARDIREAEAETALILLETLGMEGAEYCRGYVQSWLEPAHVEAFRASAGRIFRAADAILNAGIVVAADEAASSELSQAA